MDDEQQTGQQSEDQAQSTNGHPAWQEILEELPEAFHPLITPKLEKWDQGVKQRLTEVRTKYDPYKDFVENSVDPQLLQQAVALVNAIQADPEAVAKDLIEEFELGFVPKTALEQLQQQQQNSSSDDDDDLFGGGNVDIAKHPVVMQLQQQLEQVTGKLTKQEQEDQAKAQQEAFAKTLEALHTDPETGQKRDFDDMFVTALMSQGASGEEAVKQYYNTVNQAAAKIAGTQQQNTQPPPVVMGGDGTTGSGIPDGSVSMGTLKNNEVNDLVVQMLLKAQES